MRSKITYYLPKKILKISFPLTVVEKKTTYASGRSEISPVDSCIRGEIKVIPLLIPDEQRGKFIYSPRGVSFLQKMTLAIEYDGEGSGLLVSLNASQTNLVGEVISSVIDVAVSVAASAAFHPAAQTAQPAQPADPVASVEYTERQQEIMQLITPARGKTIPVVLPNLPNCPRISITFRDNPGTVYADPASGPVAGNGAVAGRAAGENRNNIWYLVAKPMIMAVVVENNAYIPRQTVAEEIIYFPQVGELSAVAIVRKSWWFFGAINTSMTFSSSTGSLQKIGVTAESNVKDWLADAQKGIDARNTYLETKRKHKP